MSEFKYKMELLQWLRVSFLSIVGPRMHRKLGAEKALLEKLIEYGIHSFDSYTAIENHILNSESKLQRLRTARESQLKDTREILEKRHRSLLAERNTKRKERMDEWGWSRVRPWGLKDQIVSLDGKFLKFDGKKWKGDALYFCSFAFKDSRRIIFCPFQRKVPYPSVTLKGCFW